LRVEVDEDALGHRLSSCLLNQRPARRLLGVRKHRHPDASGCGRARGRGGRLVRTPGGAHPLPRIRRYALRADSPGQWAHHGTLADAASLRGPRVSRAPDAWTGLSRWSPESPRAPLQRPTANGLRELKEAWARPTEAASSAAHCDAQSRGVPPVTDPSRTSAGSLGFRSHSPRWNLRRSWPEVLGSAEVPSTLSD
jgi:hypothetical protein